MAEPMTDAQLAMLGALRADGEVVISGATLHAFVDELVTLRAAVRANQGHEQGEPVPMPTPAPNSTVAGLLAAAPKWDQQRADHIRRTDEPEL